MLIAAAKPNAPPSHRPIIDRWKANAWVANTPIDDRRIGNILDEEVQIAIVPGVAPGQGHSLVPLNKAGRSLLYGEHRENARKVLSGLLGTIDAFNGAKNLRGISLSTDQAAFATNLLLSNTEAGIIPDAVSSGSPKKLEQAMLSLVPSVHQARAQNTGWIDLGPGLSSKLLRLIANGNRASRDDSVEVTQAVLHELEHSKTPPDPVNISDRFVWLEEGIAETLSWWPGRTEKVLKSIGAPLHESDVVDRWSVPREAQASADYRDRHEVVTRLLSLAGVNPFNEDGSPDPNSFIRANQLLQSDEVERVPRALARAIARTNQLDHSLVAPLAALIPDINGKKDAMAAFEELVRSSRGINS